MNPAGSRRWRSVLVLANIAVLLWLLAARALGPSDLWDNTQVKTVSYTTDMLVSGGSHWILPIERGELPATKPPLYNWLAAPCVKWLGFDSEVAHKLPSVAALLACWVIIVRLGRHLAQFFDAPAAGSHDESLGWLAGLAFLANPMMFKLGYTARPDMLVTLWLLIAWLSATAALCSFARETGPTARTSWLPALLFWLAITLGALTKGPAVLVALVYAVLAARVVGGRWSAIRALHPMVGLTLCGLICGTWVLAVWKINPQHLREQLWFNEVYGRVTGEGDEGTDHGQRHWLLETPYQSFYFLTRFLPWSIASIIGAAVVLRRSLPRTTLNLWLRGAAVQAIITVGLYSLSVGKRADYIAGAIPPAALLASWWLLHARPRLARSLPWLAPATAAIVLAILTWHNQRESVAPAHGFGDAIMQFASQADSLIAERPARIVTFAAGQTHLQAMMGIVEPDARRDIADIVRQGQPFWVVAGRTQNPPFEFDQWLSQRRIAAEATPALRSERLPRAEGWPEQVTLWRVTP